MTQFEFETEQAAWEYYLNLDSHNFEEKQHNNIYTDAFEAGAEWEHKRLVAKACEWLESAIRPYAGYSDTVDIVESFRKAMEE